MIVHLRAQDIIDPETEAHYSFKTIRPLPENHGQIITTVRHDHDFYEVFLITHGRIWHLINDQEQLLIAGDLIFYRSTGRVDLPGGDPRALTSSIERLSDLDIEYVLCGHPYGHSGVIEGADEVRQNFEFLRTHILF